MCFGLEAKSAQGLLASRRAGREVWWLAVMMVHRSSRVVVTAQVLVKCDLARVEESAGFEMSREVHQA